MSTVLHFEGNRIVLEMVKYSMSYGTNMLKHCCYLKVIKECLCKLSVHSRIPGERPGQCPHKTYKTCILHAMYVQYMCNIDISIMVFTFLTFILLVKQHTLDLMG